MRLTRLTCATWNIHRAKGADKRVDPDRIHRTIAADLAPLRLDVLALQEADGECRPHARILDMRRIQADTGLVYQHDQQAMRWGSQSDGFLGTILFLHPLLEVTHRDVVDLPGHCHRGAVVVETLRDGVDMRIFSTHLSLFQPLRVIQMRIIGQYLRRRPKMQTILLGDLNEWRPWGGLMFHRRLVGQKLAGPARATFPSHRPLLPLDRIMTDRPDAVFDAQAMSTSNLRMASDHLPLIASVKVS